MGFADIDIIHSFILFFIFQGALERGLFRSTYKDSNDVPQFNLNDLNPGQYTLLVYSETSRGKSVRPAVLSSVSIQNGDDLDRPGK